MLRTIISRARVAVACVAVISALWPVNAGAYSWERPHGTNGTNAGFMDATTLPATKPLKVIQNIGTFAPGAGPVIGPDGTIYVGNEQGKIMTFRADGTPWWSRDVPGSIVASPLLGADGALYVIAVHQFTDHRVNPPEVRLDSVLHKFSVGGGWVRQTPLPGKYGASGATAAPNMWKTGNAEVIMIPISYELPLHGGTDTHILAFSTDAQLMADGEVGVATGRVTGGSDMEDWQVYMCLVPPFISCFLPSGFESKPGAPTGPVHDPVKQPTPTAATYVYPGGGTPFILVADGFQHLVAFTFGGMNFNEIFRVDYEDYGGNMVATPTVTYDGHTIFTSQDGIRFAGPNMNAVPTVKNVHTLAAPTILRDGRIVIMTTAASIAVLNGGQVQTTIPFDDFSVASAGASHNHFFVSTWHHFITYDANTLQEVARFDWPDGGLSSPVIGPQGNVYAISSNQLYIFPGPGQDVASTGGGAANPPAGNAPTQPMPTEPDQPAQSSRQSFRPPLTASGNRLLACEKLDGEDCGKGDAKAIAQAFCAKQGYTRADDIDVDSKKVKAETLDGQYCSKNKCKVFDKIVCKM